MEIDSEIQFQQRVWAAQRIGWIIIGALVVAALAGVFGQGPVSRAVAQGGAVRIEYERFIRLQQATRLRFVLPVSDNEMALHRQYLEAFRVEQITPEPREVEASADWLTYRFSGNGGMAVTFDLIPETFGRVLGRAHDAAGASVEFWQLIYP